MFQNRKILIVQNFNPNKGNSSVITAMLYALKDSPVEISITSVVPETAKALYGVECYDWLVSYKDVLYGNTKAKKLFALIKEGLWVLYLFLWMCFYKIGVKLPVPSRKKTTIEAYFNADVVVFPGGHSFTTMNGLGQVFSHCMGFYFGAFIGKKTMVYAHTIGPFKGRFASIIKWMSLFVLNRTTLVTVREKDSLKYDIKNVWKLTAETVFAIPTDLNLAKDVAELQELRTKGNKVIGLTIHHIYYKYFFSKEQYLEIMKNIIDLICNKYGFDVLLIPMENKTGNYNDTDMAFELKAMLMTPSKFIIIESDLTPSTTASIIGNVDLFIGTKTHSIVYGLKSTVPTLSIAYQQKANEFMQMFGVIENSINLEDLNVVAFEDIFKRMIDNLDKIRETEKNHYRVIKNASLSNRDMLLDLIR